MCDVGVAPPALALVVCTRDRAARLAPTLDALGALRAAHVWELVLVDNGSRDATPALLARFAAEAARAPQVPGAPAAVTVVREETPGLARARNAGVAAARAPLLCFTDDDCYPAADFLDRWAEVFVDPAVGYGGGRVLLHDPADYPITVRTDETAFRIHPHRYVWPGLVQGANMAFRRAVVCAAGAFDPAMGPGAPFNCEDVDMAARASALGVAGGYFPGPTVRHHHGRRAGPGVAALERSYTRGRGAYHAALLLRPGSRRIGARAWALLLRDGVRGRTRGYASRVVGELIGGAHYVTRYATRPGARRTARGAPGGDRPC
ncbi:hypothetical protein tb265_15950 [Gemmatimonadetes bacterium T265]|nr:hypothetical protein tb265_15950 [Gemmatimonadetes bacterium T265]